MEEAYTIKGTEKLLSEKYDNAYYSRTWELFYFMFLKNHKELHSPNKH